jgi:hypothetical protein
MRAGVQWSDGPIAFGLMNSGQWDLGNCAVAACGRNRKRTRKVASLEQLPDSVGSDAPALGQLPDRESIWLELFARHYSTIM